MVTLVIETEETLTSSVGLAGGTLPVRREDGAVQLPLVLPRQEKARWCWAAIGAGLARFLSGREISQSALATLTDDPGAPRSPARSPPGSPEKSLHGLPPVSLSEADTGQDGTADGCNRPLDRVLDHLGLLAHWSPGKPRFERLMFEINRGLPVPLRIEWFGGDAHFVLVTGYHPGARSLLIDDSLHGPSRCPYDRFPREYRQGGVWTDTIWTRIHGDPSHGHL